MINAKELKRHIRHLMQQLISYMDILEFRMLFYDKLRAYHLVYMLVVDMERSKREQN